MARRPNASGGGLRLSLTQDEELIGEYDLDAADIQFGTWIELDGFDYSKLNAGEAVIEINAANLEGTVGIESTDNRYNLPNCLLNGEDADKTLVQRYHFHWDNLEYKIRQACYGLLAALMLALLFLIIKKEETPGVCRIAQGLLIGCGLTLCYLRSSTLFLQPVWAEAVTNFSNYALNEGFFENLSISDAGYLPLIQRLIALFLIQGLKMPVYFAVMAMQAIAYVTANYIWTFFVKINFKGYMSLKQRVVCSLLLILQMNSSSETSAYINFVTYGIYIIILYFLAEGTWSRTQTVAISIASFFICLSKGYYVVMLPFMFVCLVLFYEEYNKQEKCFIITCMAGAELQLLYYLQLDSARWLDSRGASGEPGYLLKLVLESIRDIPMMFCEALGQSITALNGIAILITAAFWLGTLYLFYKEVFRRHLRKEKTELAVRNLFMCIFAVAVNVVFFKVTAEGVEKADITSAIWDFRSVVISFRYPAFKYMPVWAAYLLLIRFAGQKKKSYQRIAVSALVLCVALGNGMLQIRGIDNDNALTSRGSLKTTYASASMLKGFEDAECRAALIQPNRWVYLKNAKIYCVGTNCLSLSSVTDTFPGDVSGGGVSFAAMPEVNKDCGIWQVFAARNNLVSGDKYTLLLKDGDGNILKAAEEDSDEVKTAVTFTLDEPVSGVCEVEIVDEEGNRVWIQNGLYFVVKKTEDMRNRAASGAA